MSERDELVARLRNPFGAGIAPTLWFNRAADQIERDGREIERLRDALVRMADELSCDDPDCDICAPARAALSEPKEDSHD